MLTKLQTEELGLMPKRFVYQLDPANYSPALQQGAQLQTASIADDAVTNAKIADGAVSIEHLDAALAPSHVVVAAGEFTTAGGDAAESITVAGLVATDIVIVALHTAGSTPRTILTASAGSGSIAVVLSGDPSTDHVLSYVCYRAAA